jgi:arabinose-5-phosphate isomerase
MVHPNDVVVMLSHSGESEEILRIVTPLRSLASALVGLTSNASSSLARQCDVAIVLGPLEEVCPLGLAPSTSTTAMIAVGDALAFVLSRLREFTHEDFARFHPAGSLGRKLMRVENVMRQGQDLRIAPCRHSVREVFAANRRRGRRTGAVMLVDDGGKLVGLFTDSDLARLFEQRRDAALDRPIEEVMTHRPLTTAVGERVMNAIETLRAHRISELPVVDDAGQPVGLLDITDLLGLVSAEEAASLQNAA